MPTSFLRYVGTINAGTSPGKLTTGYFDAPLGAVYLVGQASKVTSVYQESDTSKQQAIFSLTVQQGDYKGVAAHEYASLPTTTTIKVSDRSANMLRKQLRR